MKINEILTEWSSTSVGIRHALEAKGYKYLGQGVDQTAYLEPGTGQVLKIFGTQPGTAPGTQSRDQEMAIFWINYCKENSGNPFLPKFSGWDQFEFRGDNYLQIRMERLGKFPPGWDDELEGIADLSYDDNGKAMKKYFKKGLGQERRIWSPRGEYEPNTSREELVLLLGEKNLDYLSQTIVQLKKIAREKRYNFDLHCGNFMIRNDSTPVIVDPWVIG